MHLTGVLIGGFCFVVIGLFHPIVIRCEYHFTSRCWPVFAVAGVALLAASLLVAHTLASSLLGVTGFTCLWSIIELRHQEKRVARGWFPANPKRDASKHQDHAPR